MDIKSKLIDTYRIATGPIRKFCLKRSIENHTVPISVLFYHRVCDRDPNPWTISNSRFTEQLDWLQENVELISMDEVCRRLKDGKNDRPAVAITFDDGYADNMDFAIPEMVRRCIPLTYYVANRFVTDQTFFPHDLEIGQKLYPNSIRDIKTMAKWGVTIGAHSRDHVDFGKLTDEKEITNQIVGCRKELENMLGREVRHFAFPYGQYCNISSTAVRIAYEAGFQSVAGAYGGYNYMDQNPFFIQRLHGDPSTARIKNWVTIDSRFHSTCPNPNWLTGIDGPKERNYLSEKGLNHSHNLNASIERKSQDSHKGSSVPFPSVDSTGPAANQTGIA